MSLINTPLLRALYDQAESPSHEAYPSRFFSYILEKVIFVEPEFWVSAEQPPTGDSSDRRRVDLTVNFCDKNIEVRVLCFVELKRAGVSETLLEHNEEQLMHAASGYCAFFKLPYVYVVSTVGAKARFLSYSLAEEDRFKTLLPEDNPLSNADISLYHDPDTPSGGAAWKRAFDIMKAYPQTHVEGTQAAQPRWSQPNVGTTTGPTPTVASSYRETDAFQQQIDSDGTAHIKLVGGSYLQIPKGTNFTLDQSVYFEWTGERMYQKDRIPEAVPIKYFQGGQVSTLQLHGGAWWRLVGGEWKKA